MFAKDRDYYAWKLTSICLYFYSVEQAYVNQRKLETEAKQLQAHAGEINAVPLEYCRCEYSQLSHSNHLP